MLKESVSRLLQKHFTVNKQDSEYKTVMCWNSRRTLQKEIFKDRTTAIITTIMILNVIKITAFNSVITGK